MRGLRRYAQPEGLRSTRPGVLGRVANHVFVEDVFRHHPAPSVKRRDSEANKEVVALIAYLLKFELAALPERRELNLNPPTLDHSIRFAVAAGTNAQVLCGAPPGYELLANLPDLTRRASLDRSSGAIP